MLESAIREVEKCRAGRRRRGFRRAVALVGILQKEREATHLRRELGMAKRAEDPTPASWSGGCSGAVAGGGRRSAPRGCWGMLSCTPRPDLPVVEEESAPDSRQSCGRPRISNGETALVEVRVRVCVRRIRRKRLRPACACQPGEVVSGSAPARVPPDTEFGRMSWRRVRLAPSAAVAAAFPIDRQHGRLPRSPLSPTRRTAMLERRCAWSEERCSRRTKADQKKAKVRISMLSRGGPSGRAAGSVKALCAVKRARPSVAES